MTISQFLQFPMNSMVFRYAPLAVSNRYLRLLGRLYYIANRKERSIIERNILDVFAGDLNAPNIVDKVFEGIFSHYSEKLIMAYRDFGRLKKEIGSVMEYAGLEYLNRSLIDDGGEGFSAAGYHRLAFGFLKYPYQDALPVDF